MRFFMHEGASSWGFIGVLMYSNVPLSWEYGNILVFSLDGQSNLSVISVYSTRRSKFYMGKSRSI